MLTRFLTTFLVVTLVTTGCATQKQPSSQLPTPPPDQPVNAPDAAALEELIRVMEPLAERARATYPDAKRRFLEGLPPNHLFSITTRLTDENGKMEKVFIEVSSIANGVVTGLIAY